jgi:ankyrin repeat protein
MHGSRYREAVETCIDVLLSYESVIDQPDNGYYLGEDILSTPLGIAAANNVVDETIIAALLKKHASLGLPPDTRVLFSAILASRNDHVNCTALKVIYQWSGMPWYDVPGHQIRNHNGETALHDSVKKDAVSVVRLLLAHPQLDVNKRNEQGFTALHLACQFASNECVTLLLNHGAGIELKSKLPAPGYTALGLATISRRIDLVIQVIFF